MTWYTFTLWNDYQNQVDYHNRVNYHIHPFMEFTFLCVCDENT